MAPGRCWNFIPIWRNVGNARLQLLLWLIVFGINASAMGWKLSEFLPSFLFV
jgi:hypothetical protein